MSTTNFALNEKLYSKLLLSLEGTVLQNFVSNMHLQANGILLLHDLVQTFNLGMFLKLLQLKLGNSGVL
jgi:hypothetical protein